MAGDPISDRFEIKRKQEKLDELARKTRTKEDVEAEKKLIEETKKVDPIKNANKEVGRNDPCGCGSGKKFKKCCGTKSE